jgi:hypothetical protein
MTRIFHTVLALFLGSGFAHAQTIFNDGKIHTLNQPNGPVEILDGTTVNFNSGAIITGGFVSNQLGYTTSIYSDNTSTINLNGGNVLAPMAPGSPAGNISGIAIYADGAFNGYSGLAQGGDGAPYQQGGWGLLAHGNAFVTGGTYQGGTGGLGNDGGTAAYMVNANAGVYTSINVSGGTFIGGDPISPSAGGGTGLSITTNGTATITGGTFIGGENGAEFGGRNDSLTFSGGGQSTINILGGDYMSPLYAYLTHNDSFNFFGSSFAGQEQKECRGKPTNFIIQHPVNVHVVRV